MRILKKESIHNANIYSLSEYVNLIGNHRQLWITLAKRDIKVKYVQSKLGLLWSIIQPITAILIYSLFFKYVFKLEFNEYPYYLYVFAGILPWTLFSYLLNQGSYSLIQNQELIHKLNFPKLLLISAKALVSMVEIMPALIILLIVTFISGDANYIGWVFIPLIILLNLIVAIIPPLWISAFSLRYRDTLHAIPYLGNFGIWLTPIFWVPENSPMIIQRLTNYNPLTFVLYLYRWALFGDNIIWDGLWSMLFFIGIFLPFGLMYFKNQEKHIIDLI